MSKQKPSPANAAQAVVNAVTEQMQLACAEYKVSEIAGDPDRLQTAVNLTAAHMKGMAAGQRWLAEAMLAALQKDGLTSKSAKPTHSRYLVDVVLALSTPGNMPSVEISLGGALH